MAELGPDMVVYVADEDGRYRTTTVARSAAGRLHPDKPLTTEQVLLSFPVATSAGMHGPRSLRRSAGELRNLLANYN